MIKLKEVKKQDYEKVASLLDKRLKELDQKNLKLDLGNFLQDYSGIMDIYANTTASSIVDSEIDYYEFCFGVDCDENSQEEVSNLIKNKELNRKTLHRFRSFYHNVYEKCPESLEIILNSFEDNKELFEFVLGHNFDLRYQYVRNGQNILHTHDMYSGLFKNQGLMTYFYESLKEVIDFEDLDYLEIEDVIEDNTCRIFNSLRREISNDSYLCELLKRKYVKSPFMRLFNRIGFKNMEIITNERYINCIRARKSDELGFSIIEDEEG